MEIHSVHVHHGANSRDNKPKGRMLEDIHNRLREFGSNPSIIAGDFNFPKCVRTMENTGITYSCEDPEGRFIHLKSATRETKKWERIIFHNPESVGYIDAFRHHFNKETPISMSWSYYAYNSDVIGRFDHLYVTAGIAVAEVRYLHEINRDAEIIITRQWTGEEQSHRLSDHCPLLVRFGPKERSV